VARSDVSVSRLRLRAETLRWMIKEQKRLFVKEYETTTTQYQNLSRT
jgi:hypothetical protein